MSTDRDLLAEVRRHNLLKPLLRSQIIAEAVCSEQLSSEDLKAARLQFLRGKGIKDEAALADFLTKEGWSTEDFNWQFALPLRVKQHCLNKFRHKAEAHFLTRKNQLDQVVYSLLRTKDAYLAQELYLRINEGEANFGDLASEFSEGSERSTKGIVGPVPMTQAHPIVAEKLRTIKPGLLLEPLNVNEWWLVLRLESYTPASFNENMAERLSTELFGEWVNEEIARKLANKSTQGVKATAE